MIYAILGAKYTNFDLFCFCRPDVDIVVVTSRYRLEGSSYQAKLKTHRHPVKRRICQFANLPQW